MIIVSTVRSTEELVTSFDEKFNLGFVSLLLLPSIGPRA